MNIFTSVMNLAIMNLFCLLGIETKTLDNYDISDFNREICEELWCKQYVD